MTILLTENSKEQMILLPSGEYSDALIDFGNTSERFSRFLFSQFLRSLSTRTSVSFHEQNERGV